MTVKDAAIVEKLAQCSVAWMTEYIVKMTSCMGKLYLLGSVVLPDREDQWACQALELGALWLEDETVLFIVEEDVKSSSSISK
mmetsp:Transcript_22391/g.32172  ORF Transcript_22391/g.32172 Transcript_22391/m.32172 type:complete len:83 (+) Transcript_22391:1380-1628(+)